MHLNLPKLAIDRPVFMSCVVLLLLILGILAYSTMAVDLFPDVSFPFVIVTTPYQGASPEEIETQVSKPLEDEFSTIQGVKKVTSTNEEGFSVVMIQFNMDADVKDSEQQVKDHLSFVRPTLPKDIDEPIVRRLDPSALPIAQLSLSSTLPPAQAYDLADQVIKPQLAQVEGVGVISIQGGRKREIQSPIGPQYAESVPHQRLPGGHPHRFERHERAGGQGAGRGKGPAFPFGRPV